MDLIIGVLTLASLFSFVSPDAQGIHPVKPLAVISDAEQNLNKMVDQLLPCIAIEYPFQAIALVA